MMALMSLFTGVSDANQDWTIILKKM